MQLKAFSVYDKKADAFIPPFYYHMEAQAVRTFKDMVSNVDHAFGRHPEDYDLYAINVFDDASGRFKDDCTPRLVLSGVEARSQVRKTLERIDELEDEIAELKEVPVRYADSDEDAHGFVSEDSLKDERSL